MSIWVNVNIDKKKLLRCPKLSNSLPGGRSEIKEGVNQLTTIGQKQQKAAYIPGAMLEL